MKHPFIKLSVLSLAVFLMFSAAKPAKAFYIEMPKILSDALASLQSYASQAQEGTFVAPQPMEPRNEPVPSIQPVQPMPVEGGEGGNIPPGDGGFQKPPQPMPPQNFDGGMNQQFNDQQGGGGMGQQFNGQQDDSRRQADEQRMLKDMKRSIQGPTQNIKQFESMVKQAERSGTVVPQDIKDKLEKLKSIVATIKAATTADEIQNSGGMDEMNDLMQSLDEARQEIFEKGRRLTEMKRQMKSAESGIKMFEKQVARLVKQKLAVPAELTDNLTKIKEAIALVKNAKTWDEVETAGLEDMQDLFMNLDQSRQQLEMLARWPQTLKQVNNELNRLTREVKRTKTVVTRLAKQGIDLTGVFANFESSVIKLKEVRDGAVATMAAGNAEDAFNALQDDFFGQMDDVMESQQIINTISNLGRFTSDFKRQITSAQNQIKAIARKKLPTAELQEILDQAKAKGNEVIAIIKSKEIDEDAIMGLLQELEDLQQQFDEKVMEITGTEVDMPWEKGPQQFKAINMPSALNSIGNAGPPAVEAKPTGQTCNVNGVEVPGPCEQ